MRITTTLVAGAALAVLAIMSVRAALDKEAPRPDWAAKCLIVVALASASASVITYMDAANLIGPPTTAAVARRSCGMLKGMVIGLMIALVLSGNFTGKQGGKK